MVPLDLAGLFELGVTLGEFVTHLHFGIKFGDLVALVVFLLILVHLVWLLEEVSLQLELVFEVLLLFNLTKV